MPADVVGYVYAAALAAGGLMGFIKKGSIASGAAGAVTGALAGLGAYQSSQDPRRYHLIFAVAFVMTGLMANRFYNTWKFMPAGATCIFSSLMLGRYGARVYGIGVDDY